MALPRDFGWARAGPFGIEVDVEDTFSLAIAQFMEAAPQAMMAAADRTAEWGKNELRRPIRAALGEKVARTIRSRVFPSRGSAASLTPAISWWTNAPHIVNSFSEAFTIRSGSGGWLIIPTENAPKQIRVVGYTGRIRRDRSQWINAVEQRFGKLRRVPVNSRLQLLVADRVQKSRGKRGGYRPATEATLRKNKQLNGIVMFILVPMAKSPKLYDLNSAMTTMQSQSFRQFAMALDDIARRHFGTGD